MLLSTSFLLKDEINIRLARHGKPLPRYNGTNQNALLWVIICCFQSKNRGGKTNLQSGTYTKKTDRKPSEQLFPNMRPLSYPNLTYMKMYIRCKQYKKSTPKPKTIRTTTEISHWNEQQYKITGVVGGGA